MILSAPRSILSHVMDPLSLVTNAPIPVASVGSQTTLRKVTMYGA